MTEDAPPNNPLKRPFFALLAIVGLLVAAVGARNGAWWVVVLGVAVVLGSAAALRATAGGRNPRWLRAPLDRWWARR